MNEVPGWRIERFETIGSTSDHCAERARAGEADRLLVLAAQQTAGRGRAGRIWTSPPGNFYASALLRPDLTARHGGWFALLAGLALIEALSQAIPDPAPLALKWPNDVLADGAKLAGILLDATIERGRIASLVIGFGVNLAHAPTVPGRTTISLAALGGRMTPEALAPILCARIDHWQATLGDGGASLRDAWLARAHQPGARISVDAGRIEGEFAGIDAEGGLLLRNNGRVTVLRGGDVALL